MEVKFKFAVHRFVPGVHSVGVSEDGSIEFEFMVDGGGAVHTLCLRLPASELRQVASAIYDAADRVEASAREEEKE